MQRNRLFSDSREDALDREDRYLPPALRVSASKTADLTLSPVQMASQPQRKNCQTLRVPPLHSAQAPTPHPDTPAQNANPAPKASKTHWSDGVCQLDIDLLFQESATLLQRHFVLEPARAQSAPPPTRTNTIGELSFSFSPQLGDRADSSPLSIVSPQSNG